MVGVFTVSVRNIIFLKKCHPERSEGPLNYAIVRYAQFAMHAQWFFTPFRMTGFFLA